MDEQTRAEVIRSLRSAARALRMAEQALVRAPSQAPSPQAPIAPQQPAEPAQVAALLAFIETAVTNRKEFEEQNPESFAKRIDLDLLSFALDRKVYEIGPGYSGASRPDTYPAFTTFEKCLAVMTKVEIDATPLLKPFTDKPTLKHWVDVNQNTELVLMHYQTEGDLEGVLPEAQLLPLVEAAKAVPGSLHRVSTLLAEKGVQWEPVVNNAVNPVVTINGIQANWAAVIDLTVVAQTLASQIVMVSVDDNNGQQGWWDAARASASIPQPLLPLIRGNELVVLIKQTDADNIEDWSAKLPGWYDGQPDAPNPLSIRNVTTGDILV